MNKKKKSKPRTMKSSDGEVAKQKIFNYYIKEMEERTENFTLNNPDAQGTKFYLFQTIRSKDEVRDMIFKLAYFYDRNFVGNKDFMHIPNISNILFNIVKIMVPHTTKIKPFNIALILVPSFVCKVKYIYDDVDNTQIRISYPSNYYNYRINEDNEGKRRIIEIDIDEVNRFIDIVIGRLEKLNAENAAYVAKIEKLMAVTELVMLDIKHMDEEGHLNLTGQSNLLI